MKIKEFTSYRLIKGEDLNHHGTLIAGKCAAWFLEAGYIAATDLTSPKNTVVLKINELTYRKPARGGDIIKFTSKIIWLGRSSMVAYIKVAATNGDLIADGLITFIHIDEHGQAKTHGISQIEPETQEDKKMHDLARHLS